MYQLSLLYLFDSYVKSLIRLTNKNIFCCN